VVPGKNRALVCQFVFVLHYCPIEYFEVNEFTKKIKYMTDVALPPGRKTKEHVL